MFNPFRISRTAGDWFCVGPASAFPDLGDDRPLVSNCAPDTKPGCKVFHVPGDDPSKSTEVAVANDPNNDDAAAASEIGDMTDQVLVFRYRGKIHAVDHVSALVKYPLVCEK